MVITIRRIQKIVESYSLLFNMVSDHEYAELRTYIFFSRLTRDGDFDSPQMFLLLMDVAILVICQKFVSVLESRKRKQ